MKRAALIVLAAFKRPRLTPAELERFELLAELGRRHDEAPREEKR